MENGLEVGNGRHQEAGSAEMTARIRVGLYRWREADRFKIYLNVQPTRLSDKSDMWYIRKNNS